MVRQKVVAGLPNRKKTHAKASVSRAFFTSKTTTGCKGITRGVKGAEKQSGGGRVREKAKETFLSAKKVKAAGVSGGSQARGLGVHRATGTLRKKGGN